MTDATPRPWACDPNDQGTAGTRHYCAVTSGEPGQQVVVAMIPTADYTHGDLPYAANARFIVRAANNIDEAERALRECVEQMKRIGDALSAQGKGATTLGMAELRARKVLAKLEAS